MDKEALGIEVSTKFKAGNGLAYENSVNYEMIYTWFIGLGLIFPTEAIDWVIVMVVGSGAGPGPGTHGLPFMVNFTLVLKSWSDVTFWELLLQSWGWARVASPNS